MGGASGASPTPAKLPHPSAAGEGAAAKLAEDYDEWQDDAACVPAQPLAPHGESGGGGDDYGNDEEEDGGGGYAAPAGKGCDYGGGADGADGDRIPCNNCGRRFAPDALEKHARICAKVFSKPKKVFNSAAKRVAGTDAAAYLTRKGNGAGRSPAAKGRPGAPAVGGGGRAAGSPLPKWKAQVCEPKHACSAKPGL